MWWTIPQKKKAKKQNKQGRNGLLNVINAESRDVHRQVCSGRT